MRASTRAFPLAVAGALVVVVMVGAVDANPESAERLSIRAEAEIAGEQAAHIDVEVTDPGEVRLGERVRHELTFSAGERASLGDLRIVKRTRSEAGEGQLLVGSETVRWRELAGRPVSETTAHRRRLVAHPGEPVVEEITVFTRVANATLSEGRYVIEVPLDIPTAEPGEAVLVLTYEVEAVAS